MRTSVIPLRDRPAVNALHDAAPGLLPARLKRSERGRTRCAIVQKLAE